MLSPIPHSQAKKFLGLLPEYPTKADVGVFDLLGRPTFACANYCSANNFGTFIARLAFEYMCCH